MTAFATGKGEADGFSWTWDMRSVNGKGLDLRLRLPDWIDGLEAGVRAALGKSLARGSVTVGLRVQRDDARTGQALNPVTLEQVLVAMAEVENQAMDRGLTLAPATAADILGLRGVLDSPQADPDTKALCKAILETLPETIAAFLTMRETEGAALDMVLRGQLAEVETQVAAAEAMAPERAVHAKDSLQTSLARVLENTDGQDPDRIAQELAMLAVKSDVTEELDRLRAHIAAATDLMDSGGPVGRKLDFLMQEFNREANTLCSKAQYRPLTAIGLELKALIDQMREQVQNVE